MSLEFLEKTSQNFISNRPRQKCANIQYYANQNSTKVPSSIGLKKNLQNFHVLYPNAKIQPKFYTLCFFRWNLLNISCPTNPREKSTKNCIPHEGLWNINFVNFAWGFVGDEMFVCF